VLLAEFRLYPAVIRHFEDAVRANPLRTRRGTTSPEAQKDDSYLALLGDIYARIGRSRDAIRVLGQAIENSPDNVRDALLGSRRGVHSQRRR
jgi:tetratricopeptide (TPR) repeat protein